MKKICILILLFFTLILAGCSHHRTASESFEVQEFYVNKGDAKIYGKLYIPNRSEEKMPAVILSHSANITSASMKSYCERFAGLGYVAYAFDFCGGSKKSRSDGDVADMTVFTEMDDLKSVLAAINELEYVDNRNIYLFGTSQGGLVSALVADECPSDIKGLILFYPSFNIAELVQKFYGNRQTSPQKAFITTLLDYDVYEHIGAFQGNVLILHGSNDFIVPYSYSERAAGLYEHCQLYKIDGASHGFNSENYAIFGDYDEVTWDYVEKFLQAFCSTAAPA